MYYWRWCEVFSPDVTTTGNFVSMLQLMVNFSFFSLIFYFSSGSPSVFCLPLLPLLTVFLPLLTSSYCSMFCVNLTSSSWIFWLWFYINVCLDSVILPSSFLHKKNVNSHFPIKFHIKSKTFSIKLSVCLWNIW